MQESYKEDVANHLGVAPYAVGGNSGGVALGRGNAGRPLSSEIITNELSLLPNRPGPMLRRRRLSTEPELVFPHQVSPKKQIEEAKTKYRLPSSRQEHPARSSKCLSNHDICDGSMGNSLLTDEDKRRRQTKRTNETGQVDKISMRAAEIGSSGVLMAARSQASASVSHRRTGCEFCSYQSS